MKAMVAAKTKFAEAEEISTLKSLRSKKAKSKGKVIKLFKKQTVSSELTQDEKDQLVLGYRMKARKLARSILRKWHARLDLQEVDSVVDLSLCEAVKRYDRLKGASFMTFLFYHLRGNLIRAVSAAANAHCVPLGDFDEAAGEPSEQNFRRSTSARSANAIEIAENLCGDSAPLPDETLFDKELAELGQTACKRLDPLEQEVIQRIYMGEQQLINIASELGYSRCHISRVKKKALETLLKDLSDSLDGEIKFTPELEEDEAPKMKLRIARRSVHRRGPRAVKGRKIEADLLQPAA